MEKSSPSLADAIETSQTIKFKVKKSSILSFRLANCQESVGKMGKNVKFQSKTSWISMADLLNIHSDCVKDLLEFSLTSLICTRLILIKLLSAISI